MFLVLCKIMVIFCITKASEHNWEAFIDESINNYKKYI